MARKKPQRVECSPIRYPDGRGLSRPLDMPKKDRSKIKWFVIAAIIIGIFLINYLVTNVIYGADRNRASIEEILDKPAAVDLPVLSDMPYQSDEDIRAFFKEHDYATIELETDNDGNPVGLDILKLPEGISVLDAQVLYSQGLPNIDPVKAVELLNGGWRLTVDRSQGVSMKVRYADFTSISPEEAVLTAKVSERLEGIEAKDSGVDASGNTYESGTIEIGGKTFQWRVSACPLSDVYKINDLPDEAYYLGVHLYE